MATVSGTQIAEGYTGGNTSAAAGIGRITPPDGTVTSIAFSVTIKCETAGTIYFREYAKNSTSYMQTAGITLAAGQTYNYSTTYSGTELTNYLYQYKSSKQYYIYVTGNIGVYFSNFSLIATYTPNSSSITPPSITSVSRSNLDATISVNTGSCSGTIWYSIISASEYSSATTHYGDSGSTSSNPFTVSVPSADSYYFQVNMRYNGTYYYSNAVGPYSFATPAPTYTSCTAPTSVTCTRSRGTVTISWSGARRGKNNFISSYGIIRNTTKSTSGATTVNPGLSSTSTSGSTTDSPGSNTYYYGVRTQGSAGSRYYSEYTWSDAITIPAHPTVSIGSTVTKTQMDNLYSYINSSSNVVTKNTQINASDGNTYKSGLTAGTTQITANWYNNA